MVESVPPLNAPDLSKASYSGKSFLLAHLDCPEVSAGAAISSEEIAFSSRWMVSCVTERR